MAAPSLQCQTLTAGEGLPQAILIGGPTASGKSALAAEIARRHDGVVINADSMQVYRELSVLSARPSAAEEAAVPHRLYGFVPAGEEYTVGAYLRHAAEALTEARRDGLLPIFVGGTGLYFKALTQGLAETPEISASLKAELESAAAAGTDLHARLGQLDPEAAGRLSPSDLPRIVRALSVMMATGKPLAYWQSHANGQPLLAPGTWLGLFLTVPREELVRRITARFHGMMEAGALHEVTALARLALPPNRGIMKAHGVPHLVAHLSDAIACSAAVERGIIDTRRYAKRQMTFARGQLSGFVFATVDEARSLVERLLGSAFEERDPLWRQDLDALEFMPCGHEGRCVIHRLAFRKALGRAPADAECLAYFRENRAAFEKGAAAKIARQSLSLTARFHLTSRDIARATS